MSHQIDTKVETELRVALDELYAKTHQEVRVKAALLEQIEANKQLEQENQQLQTQIAEYAKLLKDEEETKK